MIADIFLAAVEILSVFIGYKVGFIKSFLNLFFMLFSKRYSKDIISLNNRLGKFERNTTTILDRKICTDMI